MYTIDTSKYFEVIAFTLTDGEVVASELCITREGAYKEAQRLSTIHTSAMVTATKGGSMVCVYQNGELIQVS